jgi:peptidoglycan/xylan/chitin deacetylase (PgdA/CDA1 family)
MLSPRRKLLRGSSPLILSLLVAARSFAPPPAALHPSGGAASSSPPAGLAPSSVPLFVVFGFDDNGISGSPGSQTTGGVRWVRELFNGQTNPAGSGNPRTFDGTPARFSLYLATRYIEVEDTDRPEYLKAELRAVADAGHEIGVHTHNHSHGEAFSSDQWSAEIATCKSWLVRQFTPAEAASASTGLGLPSDSIQGFRAPFLEFGPALFPALREQGMRYDCSVEEGFEPEFDGANLAWPYRVAEGYGGGAGAAPSGAVLWELPVYALTVPPDEECARYGVQPGLRRRLHEKVDYFHADDGKITGFDWNLWVEFGLTPAEFVATLRYSLDRRLAGNRAPFTFGTHSDIYSEQYETLPNSTAEERRRALAEVLADALARPEVRVVSARQLVDWLENPAPF